MHMLQCMSSLVALSGHLTCTDECPLSGVTRTGRDVGYDQSRHQRALSAANVTKTLTAHRYRKAQGYKF